MTGRRYSITVVVNDRTTGERLRRIVKVTAPADKPWQALDAAAAKVRRRLQAGQAIVGYHESGRRLGNPSSRSPVGQVNPMPLYALRAEAAYRTASAAFHRASDADARYRTDTTNFRVSRAYRKLLAAYEHLRAAEDRALQERLAERRGNPRKKKRPTGGDWQPDLFGGRGIQRREGLTRDEQLELARKEMRDTGSRDLFDLDRERNPRITPTNLSALRSTFRTSDRTSNRLPATILPHLRRCLQAGLIRVDGNELVLTEAGRRAMAERNPRPSDSPEARYQRAIGHGEHVATARIARDNPGRATGRMAPNCPMCGALVRLPNPVPPTVQCTGCRAMLQVHRP